MMDAFFPEEDGAPARTELERLRVSIDALNDQKRGWQKAWEGEVARTGDQTLEKPLELKAINKQLGPLYGRREDLLRRFPHLEAEYGGKKHVQRRPVLTVANSAAKRERAERKKANHERNLARRREEDRARARGGRGGGGKKQ